MGVALFLRAAENPIPFRNALLSLFTAPNVYGIYLCSGYFTENGYYSPSDDLLVNFLKPYGVKKITLIGGMGSKKDFTTFSGKISSSFGVGKTESYFATNRRWHAKIALALDNEGVPFAGIVGSSNLTRRALKLNEKTYNHEGDALIWAEEAPYNDYFTKKFGIPDSKDDFFMLLKLVGKQPSEKERLRYLKDQIEQMKEKQLKLI